MENNKIIFYTTPHGIIKVEVFYQSEPFYTCKRTQVLSENNRHQCIKNR